MGGRASASAWVVLLLGVVASVGGCGERSGEPVDPAAELPLVVRLVHGQGSEDRLSVSPDGVVTGRLGPRDGDRPVGCVVEASFVRDLAAAAAADLEPGATEPPRDGADYERIEVTGLHGTAWLGDGAASDIVRLAGRLVYDVSRPDTERTVCRATPDR